MRTFLPAVIAATLSFFCANDTGTNGQPDSAIVATIYEPDGEKPAVNAIVKVFDAVAAESKPVAVYITDGGGKYYPVNLPNGIYNFWAEKDSFVLFRDSVIFVSTAPTLADDTLECPASISGTVGVEPFHEPHTVTIAVVGADKRIADIDDETGAFAFTGLAAGTWTLELTSSQPGYLPAVKNVTLTACSTAAFADTFRLTYTGIPLVNVQSVVEDTLNGLIAKKNWKKTPYNNLQDYVIYRDSCSQTVFSEEFLQATEDTFFIDSLFHPLPANPREIADRCLKYRIAVRNNLQEIGPTWKYAGISVSPKSAATTFFTHAVRHADLPSSNASINDTVRISLTASNRTRPLQRLIWYDPATKDTIATSVPDDTLDNEFIDTLHYAFDSIGVNLLIAIVVDNGGTRWCDTIDVHVVEDAPKAHAGNDTGVMTGETVRLHGSATQQFGTISRWEWKIGSDGWNETAGPDFEFSASSAEEVTVCSLAVTDDDGYRGVDAIKIFAAAPCQSMVTSGEHSLILKTDGTLWGCGANFAGQLGIGTVQCTEGFPVRIMAEVKSMVAVDGHSLFLKTDGTLWSCGYPFGNMYYASGTSADGSTPVQILTDVQSMSASIEHCLILQTDGTLWGYGNNYAGQVGDTTTVTRSSPVRVMSNVKSMASGYSYSLILKTNGTLWHCGINYGFLDPYTMYDTGAMAVTPVQLLTEVESMVAGDYHSLILRTDGSLWAFGQNDFGQLGDGTLENRPAPVMVMANVKSMAVGGYHSLMLTTDGSLWGCGDNFSGQLGDGTMENQMKPVTVMTGVQSMVTGPGHSLILKTDGTLWGCGESGSGQLGNGVREYNRSIPVQIMNDVQNMAAGYCHSLILKTDKTLWACGCNSIGQLGDGTMQDRLSPVRIIPAVRTPSDGKTP